MRNKIDIAIDLDPIVNVICTAELCKYNLINHARVGQLSCNLKHIILDDGGRCSQFVTKIHIKRKDDDYPNDNP